MTPTATKSKTKPSAAKRERELEKALADAIAERDDTQERGIQHRRQINGLKQRLAQRRISDPQEFDRSGLPHPKKTGAEIAAKIEELERADRYTDAINAAQARVELAEQELFRHRADAARDLLVEMEPEAKQAVDDWIAWAEQGEAHHRRLVEVGHRATRVVTTSRLYRGNARHVPDFDHQARIVGMARERPPLPLPGPFVEEREAEQEEAEDG